MEQLIFFPSIVAAQEGARAASERVDALLQAQNAAARKKHANVKSAGKRTRY